MCKRAQALTQSLVDPNLLSQSCDIRYLPLTLYLVKLDKTFSSGRLVTILANSRKCASMVLAKMCFYGVQRHAFRLFLYQIMSQRVCVSLPVQTERADCLSCHRNFFFKRFELQQIEHFTCNSVYYVYPNYILECEVVYLFIFLFLFAILHRPGSLYLCTLPYQIESRKP